MKLYVYRSMQYCNNSSRGRFYIDKMFSYYLYFFFFLIKLYIINKKDEIFQENISKMRGKNKKLRWTIRDAVEEKAHCTCVNII